MRDRPRALRRLAVLAAAVGVVFAVVTVTVPHSAGALQDAFAALGRRGFVAVLYLRVIRGAVRLAREPRGRRRP